MGARTDKSCGRNPNVNELKSNCCDRHRVHQGFKHDSISFFMSAGLFFRVQSTNFLTGNIISHSLCSAIFSFMAIRRLAAT
jgi:hypothetical protein